MFVLHPIKIAFTFVPSFPSFTAPSSSLPGRITFEMLDRQRPHRPQSQNTSEHVDAVPSVFPCLVPDPSLKTFRVSWLAPYQYCWQLFPYSESSGAMSRHLFLRILQHSLDKSSVYHADGCAGAVEAYPYGKTACHTWHNRTVLFPGVSTDAAQVPVFLRTSSYTADIRTYVCLRKSACSGVREDWLC